MKQIFRFFTLLAVAVVTSTSAWAQIEIPKPSAVEPAVGGEYYIQHVGTGKFVGAGEAWGTQACVVDKGMKYTLMNQKPDGTAIGTDEEGNELYTLPQGQYWLWADEIPKEGMKLLARWTTDPVVGTYKACFSDVVGFSSDAARWQMASLGQNNIYTFQVPVEDGNYIEGEFLGVQTDHPSGWAESNGGVTYGLYFDVVYETAPEMCQFQFFTAEAMAAYNLKVDLVGLIETAKKLGVSTTAAEAVVANVNATAEEVQAAIDALTEELKNMDKYSFPEDITDQYIVPSIPLPNNYGEWIMRDGDGKDIPFACNTSDNIGEIWGSSQGGYSINYTIKNLPAGVYTLRVQGWTRTGMSSLIKVGDYEKKLITVTFNSRGQGRTELDNGNLLNDLKFFQDETGNVEISLIADNTTGDHWTCWSKWMLLDHGNSLDSYKKAAIDAAKGWEAEFVTTDEETGATTPISPFTQSYFDAVGQIIETFDAATSKEQIEQAIQNYNAALQTLRTNVSLYKQLKNRIEADVDPWNADFGGYTDFVNVFEEVREIFTSESYTLTNEELQALYDRYMQERENALNSVIISDYQPGDDVSFLIKNRHFKNEDGTASSFDGWTVASSNWFQNNSGALSVVEQWANTDTQWGVIDVYQEIAPPKVGVYTLKTKGWYRSTNIPVRRDGDGYNTINTFLYGASSEYPLHDIYEHLYTLEEKQMYFPKGNCFNAGHSEDRVISVEGPGANESDEEYIARLEGLGYEFVLPQNPRGADELFNHPDVNWYNMEASFIGLGADTPIRIGMRGRDIPPRAWLIWDDFELVYDGYDLNKMIAIAADVAEAAKEDVKGLMSQKAKNNLQECIDGLETPENAEQLIDCYQRIDAAREAARASKKLYVTLQSKLEELQNALALYGSVATAEAFEYADNLYYEMDEAINNGTIDDENVPAALQQMNNAISRLKIPGDYVNASDDHPVDFTAVITNPKYVYDNGESMVASLDGWTNEDGGADVELEDEIIGVAQGWVNSFNLYQDLEGLPQGTYELRVKGLFRQSSYPKDTKLSQYEYAVKLGKEDMLNEEAKTDLMERDERAKFYGNTIAAPLHRWHFMASDEWTEEAEMDFNMATTGDWVYKDSLTLGSGEYELKTLYFPAVRAGAWKRFEQGYYENMLYAYVQADGKLRIGACNVTAQEQDWAAFTDWRLYYLGTASSHEPNIDAIYEVELPANTRIDGIYTIDGRKTQRLQKGLNIIVTNGKARKVMVK